jgi:regulator of sigma E protease
MLFSGTGELRDSVAGPLRISYVIGEMRNAGIRAVLHLLAMVSISLSVVNLLPIPGLDGGTILLTLIEAVRGRPISSKWYVRYQSIGVAFLMILVFFVMSGDIRFFLLGG